MKSMMRILHDLTPLGRAVCSQGYDRAVEYLQELLPFRLIGIEAGTEHNGWVIPPCWDVVEAKIAKDGRIIYDGMSHPLAVIGLAPSFSGTVSLEELKQHLYYDHRFDDAIPYHYRQLFRSWHRDWGFCIPKRTFDALESGKYEVLIRTEESPGNLKIIEYTHRGRLDYRIVLGGNLDHSGVANDGLAGCVVGLEVMRRLRGRKTKFSYSLVLSPGIIGSEFYLASLTQPQRKQLLEGVFLEMLGSKTPLAVQASRHGAVSVMPALTASLDRLALAYRTGPFESIIVNDEAIWENYGVPMLSFSRFPFPEYHSSRDSVEAIHEPALEEAVAALMGMIDILEASPLAIKRFQGNICLSNPKYDLYVDYGQVALGETVRDARRRQRYLMDFIPALERPLSVAAIAARTEVPQAETLAYLRQWASKGLLDLV